MQGSRGADPIRGLSGLAGPGWWQTLRLGVDPVGALTRAQQRCGDVFVVNLLPAGEMVVVADPPTAGQLLRDRPLAGAVNAATLPLVLAPRSVFVLDGPAVAHRRGVQHPPLCAAMTDRWRDALSTAVDQEIPRWPTGRPLWLLPRLRRVVAEALLPVLVSSQDPVHQRRFTAVPRRQMSALALALAALAPYSPTRPLAARLLARRHAALSTLIGQEIRRRARHGLAALDTPADVLGCLLAGGDDRGRPLDDQTIADDITSLLVALIEVQTVALAWAFERLARHPQVTETLRGHTSSDADTYADAVAREVLRTRPPVIGAFRRLETPADLGGRQRPAGTTAMVALPLVHHHRDHYADPAAFRPERFLHDPPTAWLPFGAGLRRCLGAHLARVTVRTVLHAVHTRTRLRPAHPRPEKARLVGTLLVPDRFATVIRAP